MDSRVPRRNPSPSHHDHLRLDESHVEPTVTTERELLERITVRPDVLGGKPVVRDMRIAVEHILGMLAAGDTEQVLLKEYPFLEPEDIRACLVFARRATDRGRA